MLSSSRLAFADAEQSLDQEFEAVRESAQRQEMIGRQRIMLLRVVGGGDAHASCQRWILLWEQKRPVASLRAS